MSDARPGSALPSPDPHPATVALQAGPDPDFAAFGTTVCPSKPKMRQLRKLLDVLVSLDPNAPGHGRERALIELATWVRRGGEPPPVEGNLAAQPASERRLRTLVVALEAFPALRERLTLVLGRVLTDQSAVNFLARVGIPGDRGLLAETTDRLSRRLMPQPTDEEDVTDLIARLFPSTGDIVWLRLLPADLSHRFARALRAQDDDRLTLVRQAGDDPRSPTASVADLRHSLPDSEARGTWAPLRGALLDGILLLASRVSAAGLSDAILARSPRVALRGSPFFQLPRMIDGLLGAPRHDLDEAAAWATECRTLLAACRKTVEVVVQRLESQGVSVDVVYRLELIDRSLDRLELLIELLVPQKSEQVAQKALQLVATLLSERRRDRSLSDIVRTNTRLLARKIIERAGQTGEHYITVTKGEWFKMLASAGGGGILTAGTAATKFFIGWLHRPPLQELLLSAGNYAGSFILMQLLGFTLATKQPSMTAAALAGSLHAGDDFAGMVTTIARIVRSQLAAAIGNLGMVVPACIAVDQAWRASRGVPFLDADTARYVIGSLHPTQSGTIPFAAFTGVLLWMSSLAAGWLENWAVYRRIPEAIAEHRSRRWLGSRITGWASRAFSRNIAGFGGNFTLGSMLAAAPVLAKFAGLPLDVRHVTLSTGALTLAICSLGRDVLGGGDARAAMVGIGIIGTLNFGVSFVLALSVAMRARDVKFVLIFRLGWEIAKSFTRRPLRFFLPLKEPGEVEAPRAH